MRSSQNARKRKLPSLDPNNSNSLKNERNISTAATTTGINSS